MGLPRQPGHQWHILRNLVVVAPFTSKPTYFSGGQLVINAPSINEDAKLLYRRYLNEKDLLAKGIETFPQPRLVLSGKVETWVANYRPYSAPYINDIDLTSAELDAFAEMTPWINAYTEFSYDPLYMYEERRISNSRIYTDSAFITVGNFRKFPYYGSIGELYVPFGRYSTSMLTDPMIKYIGKTEARAISLSCTSYPEDNRVIPYLTVFGFKGDAEVGNSNIAKQFGFDLGSWYESDTKDYELGASYITNIADAYGMQDQGIRSSTYFSGFNYTSKEQLVHAVGGLSVHLEAAYNQYNLLAEYVTALQEFSKKDLSFNTHGAKPSGGNIEGVYSFNFEHIPSSIAIGYGFTDQALGLYLPRQEYVTTFSMTFMESTTLSIEYRHDINYTKRDYATGGGKTAYVANTLGRDDNLLSMLLGVYF